MISSRKFKDTEIGVQGEIESLSITGIFNIYVHHGIIYYDDDHYRLLPITQVSVDGSDFIHNDGLI
jgi:hypothetical protein